MRGISILLGFLFAFITVQVQAQEKEITRPTSISLQFATNVTHDLKFTRHAIGGDWGLVVDHHFEGTSMGLTASINYSLLHFGFDNGFTSPREAIEFGLLESSLGVWHYPLPQSKAFKVNASLIHGLVLDHEDYYLENYNIPMIAIGAEYAFPIQSSLALAIGWRLKYFTLEKEAFGTTLVNVLYFKVGMKS